VEGVLKGFYSIPVLGRRQKEKVSKRILLSIPAGFLFHLSGPMQHR